MCPISWAERHTIVCLDSRNKVLALVLGFFLFNHSLTWSVLQVRQFSYIGQHDILMPQQHWDRMPYLVVFGVITHSQGVITYCDYSSSEKELLTLTAADNYWFLINFDA